MRLGVIVMFLAAATVIAAQSLSPDAIGKLLPPDARVIETADLTATPGKPRTLVLWMRSPSKVLRLSNKEYYCADSVDGDHWMGPTRLSLVNSAEIELLNTIEIKNPFFGEPDDSFRLPFLVQGDYYWVPHPNAKKEGAPRLLNLRDLTGDGMAAQFVLFAYVACNVVSTSVLGYDRPSDRVKIPGGGSRWQSQARDFALGPGDLPSEGRGDMGVLSGTMKKYRSIPGDEYLWRSKCALRIQVSGRRHATWRPRVFPSYSNRSSL
jgi:hypothetical protein